MMQCVWNNVRALVGATPTSAPAAVAVKEEESEDTSEPIRRPPFFTGEIPHNAIVDLSAFNRPDQSAFIQAVNKPPPGYEEEPGRKKSHASEGSICFRMA